jgi:PhnB protein
MKTFNPYINFSGHCQDALAFYETTLNGKVVMRQTFGQAPQAVSGVNPAHIMHAEFKAEGIYFMATDGLDPTAATVSHKITLNIGFDNADEQLTVFNALSEEGEISMPLNETFWGARFGIVKDKFGISWMLNHQLSK